MKRKLTTRIIAVLSAMVTAVTMMATSASATSFSLKYIRGATSSVNRVTQDITVQGTAKIYATLTCNSFNSDSPGALARGDSIDSRFPTGDAVFYAAGTYYMYYQGDAIPSKSAQVSFNVHLEAYGSGGSSSTSGTIV